MNLDKPSLKILAIETSCDETAAAVISRKQTANGSQLKVLSNIVSSQIDLHRKYGGVFPELASRAHTEKIIPVVEEALMKCEMGNSKWENSNLASLISNIDLIAVTTGPGLIGSLLCGVNFAKTLAFISEKPIIGINHLLGHIYSNFGGEYPNQKRLLKVGLSAQSGSQAPQEGLSAARDTPVKRTSLSDKRAASFPEFPVLNLIVSGGHTGMVLMKNHQNIREIGQTLDDSAGEAFDKVAQILGLSYPGGPIIEKIAQEFECKIQNENLKMKIKNVKLPRPMIDSDDFNFSFSGLKTAVLYLTKKLGKAQTKKLRAQIATEFQQAVIDVLIAKTLKAAQKYKVKSICLSGGVSANKEIREQLKQKISLINQSSNYPIIFHCPPMELTTDNAAMIGVAAAFQPKKAWTNWPANRSLGEGWLEIQAKANLRL